MKLQTPKATTTHTPFINRDQPPLFQKKPKGETVSKETSTETTAETVKKEETSAPVENQTSQSQTFFPPKPTVSQENKTDRTVKPVVKENATPITTLEKTPNQILSTETGKEPIEKTPPTEKDKEIKVKEPDSEVKENEVQNTEVSKGTSKKGNSKVGGPKKLNTKKAGGKEKIPENGQDEKRPAVGEPIKEVTVSLPTENSKAFTQGLATQAPTNFVRGLKQSGPELQQSLDNEKATLQESLPEIEQPTGIPTKKAHTESKQKQEANKSAEQLKNSTPELQELTPTGKKEGEKVLEESKQPKSTFLDKIKSFFNFFGSDDDKKSSVKSGIRKLPTSENVNTDPGEKPTVDLSGQANPEQNKIHKEASDATMIEAQQKNKAESELYKGEDDIYPEMELEMLAPSTELTPAQANTALEEGLPPVTADVEAAFNANSREHFDPELAPQVEKQNAEYTKMQQDQENEQQLADQKIDEETQRVKLEQETAQTSAKQEVNSQRTQWKKENEDVKKEYANKSEKEKKRIDGEIDTKVSETDTKVTKEYNSAQTKADNEVASTNKEAKKRKAEAKAKSEKKSWWDRAVDAVSDFFDALKEGLNKLFDGLKSLVKGIIEAAKKLVNKLIDLARDFVVGLIKAFGEILKGLVNIALAAFPKLRDKFNAAIDKAVNTAVNVVNKLAEGLKKAVNMLLDALGKVLDFILSAYQAIFNALLDVLKFLAVGLIKIIQFLWNLVLGANIAPFEFFGQLAEESLGANPADPLKDVEVPLGQEDNWAAAMGLSPGESAAGDVLQTEAMTADVKQLLTKQELSDDDVMVEPYPAVTLDATLLSQIPPLQNGEAYDLGGAGSDAVTTEQFQASAADAAGYNLAVPEKTSAPAPDETNTLVPEPATDAPDWRNMSDDEKLIHYNEQMLVESAEAGNTPPTPEGGKAPAPTVDNSPEALITKTGRLDVARRLSFMGDQMMTGLQVFWNKNKVWIIAALVVALLAAGLVAFFTGGAGLLVAVDIIAKALIIIFGAIAVFKAMGYIWEYVKKAWAGDPEGAGKALARALAVIVVEFLIDKILLGMGKVFKRILNAAKATKVGRMVTKGAAVVRKGAQKGAKVVKKGIAKIKNSKLVVRMSGGIGRGVKKLGKLRQKILEKFKFKRIWFEKHGMWIELWGEFNSKIMLVRERSQPDGNKKVSHQHLDDSLRGKTHRAKGQEGDGIVGGRTPGTTKQVIVSDRFARDLDELKKLNPEKYKETLEEINRLLKNPNTTKQQLRDLVDSRVNLLTTKNPKPTYTPDEIAEFAKRVNQKYTFSDELAEKAREVHNVLKKTDEAPGVGFKQTTVAIARVEENGKTVLYASGNGAVLSPAQRDKLISMGIPEKNIFSGVSSKKLVDGDMGTFTKLSNHAERVIERKLPPGAKIKEWGVSWSTQQKNAMCEHCLNHFSK